MPHCIGAIDGRHVPIIKPANSGLTYRNYKGGYSIVLQAVVNSDRKYLFIDVCGFGSQHDGGTFLSSSLYKALCEGLLNIPEECKTHKWKCHTFLWVTLHIRF